MNALARACRLPAACFLLTLVSAVPAPAKPPKHAIQPWVEVQLFFGLSKPGGEVTSREWQSFVDEVVTPAFPDGLTILDGDGQWKRSGGRLQREHSRVLILLYQPSRDLDAAIEAIRTTYKKRFRQESVLRVTYAAAVSF